MLANVSSGHDVTGASINSEQEQCPEKDLHKTRKVNLLPHMVNEAYQSNTSPCREEMKGIGLGVSVFRGVNDIDLI